LADCLDALIDYRGKTPDKTDSGIPLITAKIIKAGRIETPTEFIAFDNYEKWMRRGIPQAGDVVLTVEAPLGEVAQLGPEKIALAQRVVTLRGKQGLLDSTYLRYLLQSDETQAQLKSRATGTTVLGIKQSELRKVMIEVPPLTFQMNAATTLKALDDRIALLRETNATLEAIAQALFKSWFVDFDPVRAKMEGRLPDGMDDDTAALFPDGFEESELGLVPRGWTVKAIKDLLELGYGKALKATDRVSGNVPVYGSGGITGFHNQHLVNGPSIVVGRKGTVGSLYWEDRSFFPIDTVFYVKTEYPMTYCYYLLQRLGLPNMNTDAAVPGLNRNNVYRLLVAMPCAELLARFDKVITVTRELIFSNQSRSESLASVRDTLLPRLISGQLRLPTAAVQVADPV
jgi:type I restriction enzyme S subunit